MDANLRALVQRVWLTNQDSPVRVTMGAAPDGYAEVERYICVPRASAARLLVPGRDDSVAAAALWRYRSLKPIRIQALRMGLAAVFATGAATRVFGDHLVVSIDRRIPTRDHADWLLMTHLARVLERPHVHAAVAVRRANPNAKPTLQIFSDRGEPAGYAKIGWSPATIAMVRAEADAISAVEGTLNRLIVPNLLSHDQWRGLTFSITRPLPERLRPWRAEPARTPGLLMDLARTGAFSESTLAGSPYARHLRTTLQEARESAPRESDVLLSWLVRLENQRTLIRFGRWHGDWVRWNLGHDRGRVAAWDWEHSSDRVPIGFDMLHWHFQQTLASTNLASAVSAVESVTPQLRHFGVADRSTQQVAALYLLEMFTRAVRLHGGGGGWNPRMHPEMLQVANAFGQDHAEQSPE